MLRSLPSGDDAVCDLVDVAIGYVRHNREFQWEGLSNEEG